MYEQIFILAKERGIQQKELAKHIGVAPSVLSDWKKGRIKPSTEMIIKIADFYEVTVDHLLSNKITAPLSEKPEIDEEVLELAKRLMDLPLGLKEQAKNHLAFLESQDNS